MTYLRDPNYKIPFKITRWVPPPPLCDCCRPATGLERIIWWVRAKLHRLWYGRTKVEFRYIHKPDFLKGMEDYDFPITKIIENNSVKGIKE